MSKMSSKNLIMSDIYNYYLNEGRKKLANELNIPNLQALPKLEKIVLNIGLGEALTDKKVIETAGSQLAQISGQKPKVTHASRDISGFKLRKGDAIGLKVTLRSSRMYNFMEKLGKIVLPRIRDFRGLNRSGFDNHGNYTFGLAEQIVFPEIEYSKIDKIRGLEITFVINRKDKQESKLLLEILGMRFSKIENKAAKHQTK